jgi:antitoxin HicB
MKNLQYYLSLPYTIVLKKDEDGDTVARVQELQGCSAHGSTQQEALSNIAEAMGLWISDALEKHHPVPEPEPEEELPSGKWVQRVPRSLHHKVAEQAKREGVSLNQWVSTVLAETIGERKIPAKVSPLELPNKAKTISMTGHLKNKKDYRPYSPSVNELASPRWSN